MAFDDTGWNLYKPIVVQSSKVDADLTGYVVYVDLSDITDSAWWSAIANDGADLRVVRDSDAQELAHELVSIDTTAETGELHFRDPGTLSSTSNTRYRLYAGNSGASAYATTDTYGRNAVWVDYELVTHMQSTIVDSTGNHTLYRRQNSSFSSSGQMGGCTDFDGDDDYIETGYSDTENALSISAWANLNVAANFHVLSNRHADPVRIFSLTYDAGNDRVRFNIGSDSDNYFLDGTTNVADMATGEWHFIAGSYEDGGADFWFDGVAAGSPSGEADVDARPTDSYFGARHDSAGGDVDGELDGKLDEVRVFAGVFTTSWIATEYNNQSDPATFFDMTESVVRSVGGGAAFRQRTVIF